MLRGRGGRTQTTTRNSTETSTYTQRYSTAQHQRQNQHPQSLRLHRLHRAHKAEPATEAIAVTILAELVVEQEEHLEAARRTEAQYQREVEGSMSHRLRIRQLEDLQIGQSWLK